MDAQISAAHLVFWAKHKIAQRFLDLVWLSRLNSDIQKEKKLPYQNIYHSLSGQEILAILEIHANKCFFFGKQDRDTLFLEYNRRFPESTSQLIEEADDLRKGIIHYAGEFFCDWQ